MQKFLSILIVFIISVFPIVNASASADLSSCEHVANELQPMSTEAVADDCCEVIQVIQVICDHVNACDCENSQVNYSAVPTLHIVHSQYLDSFKPLYTSTTFHSKPSDSLYRPPIDILF